MLIPAHNEELVITTVIKSITVNDYPTEQRETPARLGFDLAKSEVIFQKQSEELVRICREVLNTCESSDD